MNSLFNQLSERLIAFCDSEGLPRQSADELLHEDITPGQRRWLSSFVVEWDEVVAIAEAPVNEIGPCPYYEGDVDWDPAWGASA